ncbi:MAG: penicillin acylase family protein [Pseudomonadales bacterium]
MMINQRTVLVTAVCIAILLLPSCTFTSSNGFNPASVFNVTVYRTKGGIPHIVAEDWSSIGYGTGYAAAEDHFCEQARNVLKFRGELSANFGDSEEHRNSDFFYKLLEKEGIFDETIDDEFNDLFAGYAAGFNRYTRDKGVSNTSDPACKGAQWIPTLTARDVKRFHLTPAFLPSFSPLILTAKPPAVKTAKLDSTYSADQFIDSTIALTDYRWSFSNPTDKGSNGVAIGKDASTDGAGLLFANPHLEWKNFDFRMYAMHQIIPGVSNMLGANQAQRAHVGFGTNGHVAWTNTVSRSKAFTFYKLDLVPGNPLRYVFDGKEVDIEPVTVSIDALGENDQLTKQHHTFYKANHGYMVGGKFPWVNGFGVSVRIANEGARGFQGGAMAMANAKNVEELKQAINTYQSTPGINTIAADKYGRVFYGDLGPVVNLSNQQLADCVFKEPLLKGNTSDCSWNTDTDSATEGVMGASKQASLIRDDYVTNSNDSYWLSNPNQPLRNIPDVQGNSESERTLRTRSGLTMVQQRINGSDGLQGKGFDIDSLSERMMSNQHYAGQILRDDLVSLCKTNPQVVVDAETVDLNEACKVLADWDLSANLDSQGAHLFREFLRAANQGKFTRWLPKSLNYTVGFDVDDPVNTPRGLNTTNNPVAIEALARAVVAINKTGISLDAPLSDIQHITRNGRRIALPGGEEFEGIFNKMAYDPISREGYPDVTGSAASWVMTTRLTLEHTVVKGVLAYSQSSNPQSPHYSDMTELFSQGELIDIPFTEQEVKKAALSEIRLTE